MRDTIYLTKTHSDADERMRNLRVLVQTLTRLTEPPQSLQIPTGVRTEQANLLLNAIVPFEGDMAARMLRLNERQPDPEATWKALTRAERKRARNLWDFALDAGFDSAPQGRPSVIDSALVLYCSRVIAEACGKPKFQFSRPMNGGSPRGPMWKTVMAALALAESFLLSVDGQLASEVRDISEHTETIAEILSVARSSQRFAKFCQQSNLGSHSSDVVQHPAMFRYAVLHARRPRQLNRRS
jgi:hypothetical protein